MSIYLLLVLILVIGFEISLRAFYREKLRTHFSPLIYRPTADGGYRYIPNARSMLIQPYRRVEVKINSHGFLGPEFPAVKQPSSFRIIVVGYSMLFEENGRIQEAFVKKGYAHVEVINCSIDGGAINWNLSQMIREDLINFHPDLVLFETPIPFKRSDCARTCFEGYIIQYSSELPGLKERGMNYVHKIRRSKFQIGLYEYSYIIRAIAKRFKRAYVRYATQDSFLKEFLDRYVASILVIPFYSINTVYSGKLAVYNYTAEETMDHLKRLEAFLKSKGTDFAIFDYFEGRKEKAEICKSYNIRFFDLGISGRYFGEHLTVKHNSHPSEKGLNEIAEAFYRALIANKLIPDQYLRTRSEENAAVGA